MIHNMRQVLISCGMALAVLLVSVVQVNANEAPRPVSGVLAAANGIVEARPMGDQNAPSRRLRIGGQIFFEDEVMTGPGVRAQILLRDGTTFSLGEGARLVLDEFVYDPSSGEGGVGAVIKRGAFRFVSGRIAKLNPQNMKVIAGNSSIAVRGTEVIGTIGGGQDSVILLSGQIDVASLSAACTGGSAAVGNDMFSFGDNGNLELNADTAPAADAGCNQSLVRSGFGVQLGQSGQLSSPSRVDVSVIDSVIDAVSIKDENDPQSDETTSQTNSEEGSTEAAEAVETDQEEAENTAAVSEDSTISEDTLEADTLESDTLESDQGETDTVQSTTTSTEDNFGAVAEATKLEDTGSIATAIETKPEEVDLDENLIVTGPATLLIGEDGKSVAEVPVVNEVEQANALSDFDKVVMRAFGMMEEADKTDVAAAPVIEINMVETKVLEEADQKQGNADKQSASESTSQPTSEPETELRMEVEEIDEKTVAEAEQRRDVKIEEASRDLKESQTTSSATEPTPAPTPTPTPTPANNVPTLAAITGVAFSDTSADDSFSNAPGTLTGSDSDSGDTLTYSVTGGSSDTSQAGYNQSRSGTYGTLFLNSGTGAYLYIPSDSAVEGTTSSQSEAFTLSVSDGSASASQTLTATIAGTNDDPLLGTLAGISVTDTSADDTFADTTSSLSASDRDSGDNLVYAISGGASDTSQSGYTHSRSGTYGTLYLNKSTGAYKYVANDSAVEGLKTAQSESFTMSVSDGTATATQTLTTSVNGADDAPALAALTAITVTDTAADDSFSATTATATGTDRDSSDTLAYGISGGGTDNSEPGYDESLAGVYGTLYLNTGTGAYKYIPDETSVEQLTAQQTETFTLTASDGSTSASQTLTTTIDGTNDTPVLSTVTSMSFTDTSADNSFSASSGTLSATERDSGDTLTYSISGASADTSLSGFTHSRVATYGTLFINSGTGSYRFVPRDSAIEGATSAVTDAFTMSVSDGSASADRTLTVNVAGANDTPGLASISGISFTDTAGDDTFTAATATLSGTDRDSGDTLTYSISGGSADTSLAGYTHAASGTYGTLYVNSSSGAYSYVPNDNAMEGLTSTQTDSFTLSVSDGTASASQSLTATVTGVNDTPSLAGLVGISLTDTANDDSFTTTSQSLSASDRDSGDTLTYSLAGGGADSSQSGYTHSVTGSYGTMYVNSSTGDYRYIPNDTNIERLTDSQSESFTFRVVDGTASASRSLPITVTGVNDTPVLSSISAISVVDTTSDDTFSTSSGTFSATDRDSGQTITFGTTETTNASPDSNYTYVISGDYGLLLFNRVNGNYEYQPNDTLVEALSSSATDTFNITASDGTANAAQTLTVNLTGADDGPSAIDTSLVSGNQQVGIDNLRVGVTRDPEGDTVTDLSSSLPVWLTFGNQTLGDGSVEYFWETGTNELPWRNGSTTVNLSAQSSGQTVSTSLAIQFVCSGTNCSDFVQSTNTLTSPTIQNATAIDDITSGLKINSTVYGLMDSSAMNTLFSSGSGTFRQVYTGAEANAGGNAGSWDINQTVTADYANRQVNLTSVIDANNIHYFGGTSDTFTYTQAMSFSDIQKNAIFVKKGNTENNASGYTFVNDKFANVDLVIQDQIGFLSETNGGKAAVISTMITPSTSNPAGYNDGSHDLITPEWRVLEPQ